MKALLYFAIDRVWPFCGWRIGRTHDLYFGRMLTVTAESICRTCNRRWMVHEHQPGMLPWDDSVEAFFARRGRP